MSVGESYRLCEGDVTSPDKQSPLGEEMRAELILRYLPLVRGIARRCGVLGRADAVDIIQEGVVGLIQAVDRFDPCRGVQVSSYAYWWIRKAILTAAYPDDGGSDAFSGRGRDANVAANEKRVGKSPTVEESADRNRDLDSATSNAFVSMRSDRYGSSHDLYVADYVTDRCQKRSLFLQSICLGLSAEIERWKFQEDEIDTRLAVMDALSTLTSLERTIICLRYGLGKTAEAVSVSEASLVTGLSREKIRRLEESALFKLRNVSCRYGLRVLLGEQ